jgi:hypothetical protein
MLESRTDENRTRVSVYETVNSAGVKRDEENFMDGHFLPMRIC